MENEMWRHIFLEFLNPPPKKNQKQKINNKKNKKHRNSKQLSIPLLTLYQQGVKVYPQLVLPAEHPILLLYYSRIFETTSYFK